jgi:D-glycero-alpha-D-manno-heptose 1-phosphate guanylyltransferase
VALQRGVAHLLTIAVKDLEVNQRYGRLFLDENERITGFYEKSAALGGLINGGIYILDKTKLSAHRLPNKFSFEKDFLEIYYENQSFYGMLFDGYFIDIGVPEDYKKAKHELYSMM